MHGNEAADAGRQVFGLGLVLDVFVVGIGLDFAEVQLAHNRRGDWDADLLHELAPGRAEELGDEDLRGHQLHQLVEARDDDQVESAVLVEEQHLLEFVDDVVFVGAFVVGLHDEAAHLALFGAGRGLECVEVVGLELADFGVDGQLEPGGAGHEEAAGVLVGARLLRVRDDLDERALEDGADEVLVRDHLGRDLLDGERGRHHRAEDSGFLRLEVLRVELGRRVFRDLVCEFRLVDAGEHQTFFKLTYTVICHFRSYNDGFVVNFFYFTLYIYIIVKIFQI